MWKNSMLISLKYLGRRSHSEKNVNVTANQCAVNSNNIRRTYKTPCRLGAQQKAYMFYPDMEKLSLTTLWCHTILVKIRLIWGTVAYSKVCQPYFEGHNNVDENPPMYSIFHDCTGDVCCLKLEPWEPEMLVQSGENNLALPISGSRHSLHQQFALNFLGESNFFWKTFTFLTFFVFGNVILLE